MEDLSSFKQPMTTRGDIIVEDSTPKPVRLAIGGNGTYLGSNGTDVSWSTPAGGSGVSATAFYGDGSDGSLTFDGSTTILGIVPSGNVYTVTKNIYSSAATVNNGVTVKYGNTFRFLCTGTLTVNSGGVIAANGNAGSGATQGAQTGTGGIYPSGGVTAGGAGGAGGAAANGAGSNGVNPVASNGSYGGSGGAGGDSVALGGTGGTVSAVAATNGTARSVVYMTMGATDVPAVTTKVTSGAGGGGGGAGAAAGGGGGGGAGILVLCCKSIVNNGTISANGGNGGNGSGATGAGGGGGGGGMVCYLTNSFTGNTPTVTGGSVGTGAVGTPVAGSSGTVIAILNNA